MSFLILTPKSWCYYDRSLHTFPYILSLCKLFVNISDYKLKRFVLNIVDISKTLNLIVSFTFFLET